MRFAFVIATLDRPRDLQECIVSIEKAYDFKINTEIEILIVSQDRQKTRPIEVKYPEFTKFYHIDKIGLAAARNFAIKQSNADYFVFLDDDAEIKVDFLYVLAEIVDLTGAEALCGRILDLNSTEYFSKCFEYDRIKYLKRTDFRCFMGSSHIFKKSIFKKIGFYDERFGAGAKYAGAEESDMFFRIKLQNRQVIYVPKLIFYHPISFQVPASKVFDYSFAVGAMFMKQMLSDSKHFLTYSFIIGEVIIKSFLRALQAGFFKKKFELKDSRFHYKAVLMGTLKGLHNYIKNEDRD